MDLLRTESISKHFGGIQAVDGLDLQIAEGEIFGLIGPNGAGKTTAFNLIAGTYAPDRGKIWFLEEEITGLQPFRICKLGLTRTYQLVKPFKGMTTFENVLVGAFNRFESREEAREYAGEVMQLVGLWGKRDHAVEQLTIADRKRVEFARALATKPRLLLLDEVMAGLTNKEVADLVALARKIRESGVTLLVIEHVMAAVMALSDRIVVLDNGRKICEGTGAEVCRDPKVVEAYLGRRACVA